jgi:pimeloyl-ACP methyl ester carboxylesterase
MLRCGCRAWTVAQTNAITNAHITNAHITSAQKETRMGEMQAKTGTVDFNGTRFFYEEAGEGQPLVMLHAGIANLHQWDEQVPAFAQRFRVVRYDLRSYGQSHLERDQPWAMHEDLRGMLDALSIPRAILMGCSMGGQTILDFALTYPERVAALIPVGPGLSGFTDRSEEGEHLGKAIEEAFERKDFEGAVEAGMRMWVDGPSRPAERVNPAMRAKARAMMAAAFAIPDISKPTPIEPPAIGRLSEIAAPTLIVLGENDVEDIQRVCHLLARDVPGARLEVISDAAHLPNMDHPGQFNRLVLDFLAEL